MPMLYKSMSKFLPKKLFGNIGVFAIIGAIGFIVDASLLKLYMIGVSNDPVFGRVISFPIAVTVTWLLNRRYTFAAGVKKLESMCREFGVYVLVNGVGALINVAIFMLAIFFVDIAKVYPIITLGMASLMAMFYNYFASKHLVFQV